MAKHPVYFIGIGGIGMSGVAQYFLALGHPVAGYDRTLTPLTTKLAALGALITDCDVVDQIPVEFTDPSQTKIVYTPAIPDNSPLLVFFKENGFQLQKRAAVIGEISKTMPCLAVAGTHGKTTTSALLTHLLRSSGKKITAFLGGISENIDSNFLLEGQDALVVEADEFDRSFMHLQPTALALTSTDADHLDIYGTADELTQTFMDFASKVPAEKRFIRHGLDVAGNSFGLEEGTYQVVHLRTILGSYSFDFVTPNGSLYDLRLPYPGHHNLMNAAAAIALAMELDCSEKAIRKGLQSFAGVDRRFSIRMTEPKILVDDYAHHPTEINAVYDALDAFYPNKRKLAIFQPHLFSRTRDFASSFKEALARFDERLLLDIYPARELPMAGVNSELLLSTGDGLGQLVTKEELAQKVCESTAEIIAVMGAGDIAFEVENIVQSLKKQQHA